MHVPSLPDVFKKGDTPSTCCPRQKNQSKLILSQFSMLFHLNHLNPLIAQAISCTSSTFPVPSSVVLSERCTMTIQNTWGKQSFGSTFWKQFFVRVACGGVWCSCTSGSLPNGVFLKCGYPRIIRGIRPWLSIEPPPNYCRYLLNQWVLAEW